MSSGSSEFETTLWSQILLVAREPQSVSGQKAAERLCEIYWYPIYAFVRRNGYSPADAEDLTQGFFAQVLGNGFFARADPERGRFRSFLLHAVGNYLSDQRDRARTQRRGGLSEKVPIDVTSAETWIAAEASPTTDAVRAFDRSWTMTVIDHAMKTLEREQAALGKTRHFEMLKEYLQRQAAPGEYDAVARQLGLSKGAVSVSVHRLSERLGELVRDTVRDTVVKPEMADEEMRFLFSTLAG